MTLIDNTIDIIKRIYRHFDTPPANIQLVNYRFYMLSNLGQTLAWATHAAWMVIFFILRVYPLAWIQIASILVYVLAIILNRKAYHMWSMTISLVELSLHQVLAVRFLGWDAGFQYFIPVGAIFPFLIPKANLVWKWMIVVFLSVSYLCIELFMRKSTPLYDINHAALKIFDVVNILLAFGFFTVWAFYFTVSVNRSDIIIEKQTRELAQAEHAIEQAKIQQRLEMQEHETMVVTQEKERYEELLLNILPYEVAQELKEHGKSEARMYNEVTVMFTDFKGFTKISEKLKPEELVHEIDVCFKAFDNIISKYEIEKIKTIGDSYMAVSGLPVVNDDHAEQVVKACLEIQDFMRRHNSGLATAGKEIFETRIGVHTGSVVAGIVGVKKFAYDIWGDTVNIASRMESSCKEGKVNISGTTYELIKDQFACTYRGKIEAKNKGEIDMYFVDGPLNTPTQPIS
jgi:class 3 adenylate cyclase